VGALGLILAYIIGRPKFAVDPDRADLEEYRLLAESPELMELKASEHVTPALAVWEAQTQLIVTVEGILGALKERAKQIREETFLRGDDLDDLHLDDDEDADA
jgi:hypothetical protein